MNQVGVEDCVQEALDYLGHRGVERVWLHVDVDVLDPKVMPAVDDHLPGGLSYRALRATLQRILASGLITGLDVTIFDPTLDPDGALAAVLTSTLRKGLMETPGD
jgi:arginase